MTTAAPENGRRTEIRLEIDDLAARIARASALTDTLEHDRLGWIRRFDELGGWADQGARSCAEWLSWRVGMSPGTAREQVRVARALGLLPLLDAAFGRGEISYSKVRAMTRTARPEFEATFLELARHATAAQVEALCRRFQPVVDPASPVAERFFRRRDLESGMVRVEAQLLPEEAAVVMKAVEAALRISYEGDVPAGTGTRGPASALVSVCESFLAHAEETTTSVPGRFEVGVYVSAGTLSGTDETPGELQDGARISAETARRIACDAPIVEIAATASNGAGTALDLGRRTRRISFALRRALEKRDRTCRFPGCTCRIFVDAHHVQHWSQAGETKLANLLLLCRYHHMLVHEGGFRVEKDGDERFRFLDPWDREVEVMPRAVAPPADSIREVARDHPGIDEASNAPLWDGSRMNHAMAVDGLLAGLPVKKLATHRFPIERMACSRPVS